MKIVVVGPGAMGCLFAAFLSKSKEEVWLFEPKNKEILDEIKKSLQQAERISLGSFEKYLPKKEKNVKRRI